MKTVIGIIILAAFLPLIFPTPAQAQTWEQTVPLNLAREGLTAVTLEGKIYAIGGNGLPGYVYATVEQFDPVDDEWTEIAPLNYPRTFASAAAAQGKIFVFGGRLDSNTLQPYVEMFDPSGQTWTVVDTMIYPREGLTAVTVGDEIWVIGGYSNALGFSDIVEVFDPVSQDFTGMYSEMFIYPARVGHAAAVAGAEVHLLGGVNYNTLDNHSVWLGGSWVEASALPTSRFNLGSVILGDSLFAAGGYNGVTSVNTVEIYLLQYGTWMEGEPLLNAREAFGMTVLNECVYAIGGYGAATTDYNYLSSVERLDPSAPAGVKKRSHPRRQELSLSLNPNPFNSSAVITFDRLNSGEQDAVVAIYDISGREVYSWKNVGLNPHTPLIWNGTTAGGMPAASGIYYVLVRSGNLEICRPLLLLK